MSAWRLRSIASAALATELSPEPSICQSVGLSVCKLYCGKMADWIRIPFGMVSGRSRDGCFRWVVVIKGEGAVFLGELGASHCNQWPMGPLLCSCAEVRGLIELLFGVVSGVTQAFMYCVGSTCLNGKGGFWGRLPPLAQWFQWRIL